MSRQNSPTAVRQAQRRIKALALRAQGETFEVIGEHLGVTKQAAHRMVTEAVTALPVESLAQVRALECERLDALHAAVWPQALDGDLRAVDRALRIMERRARLLSLDAEPGAADGVVQLVVGWPAADPRAQPEPLVIEAATHE